MLRLSLQDTAQDKKRAIAVIILVVLETLLVTMALVPQQAWAHLLPDAPNAAQDGPFPASVAVVIPVLLYVIPTVVGFLCRNWQQALFYATLPAWIGLGLFVTAASFKVGIFYLVSADSVTSNVSILELFAALGGVGWLAQYVLKPHFSAR
ncbi:MAG TPA: hypothetical protein VFV38_27885 [Ktedonobacteraceae bacterium]|nr:hypothetical protein [Ktedonobacteraceae bacterium]